MFRIHREVLSQEESDHSQENHTAKVVVQAIEAIHALLAPKSVLEQLYIPTQTTLFLHFSKKLSTSTEIQTLSLFQREIAIFLCRSAGKNTK